ncbi:MAG: outer membrane beta-barrel protein [Gemmatimonadota bacterium]
MRVALARRAAIAFAIASTAWLGAPPAAEAQRLWEPPRGWMGIWFGGLFPDDVDDPDTGTWRLGDNVAGGVEMALRLGDGAFVVADVGYTRTGYDRVDGLTSTSGDADIFTTALALRYNLVRGPTVLYSPFGVVGLGAVHYRLSDLDRFDTDFAIQTGGGLEFRLSRSLRLNIAAHDFLVFHQRASSRGDANISHLTELRLGLRWGL